ncbi:MAG: ribosome silencing factor [Bacilli bacterium]|nr:ribosome silencing factor [Bacilli bacterium]
MNKEEKTIEETLELAKKVLDEHKGENITEINVEDYTPFATYYLLATCLNPRQLSAMRDYLEEAFESNGIEITGKDGEPESGWMIIQGGEVAVHLFLAVNRKEIDLEGFMVEMAQKVEKARRPSRAKK